MMELQQERTLANVRLHWGIFIPVVLLACGLIVVVLTLMSIVHVLRNVLGLTGRPFNQPPAMPGFDLIWVRVLVPYLVTVLGLALGTWFAYSKSEVTLTNWRLVFRTGFLSRRSGEVPLENVESIYISEPILGRMCGYGTVMVTTVGGASFPLSFIGSPQSFHATLQKAVLNAKNSIRGPQKPPDSGSPPQDDDTRYRPH
jgi:hypothetical protein